MVLNVADVVNSIESSVDDIYQAPADRGEANRDHRPEARSHALDGTEQADPERAADGEAS